MKGAPRIPHRLDRQHPQCRQAARATSGLRLRMMGTHQQYCEAETVWSLQKARKASPVISAASLKALTRPAASCPVMASTTSSVSEGCTVA